MKHIVALLVVLLYCNLVYSEEVEAQANNADLPSPVFDPNALNYDQSVNPEFEVHKAQNQPVEDDAQADHAEAEKSGAELDESVGVVNNEQNGSADETTTVSYTTTDSYVTTTPSYSTDSYSTTPSYTTSTESYSTTPSYSTTTPSYSTTAASYSTTTASYSTAAPVYSQETCCNRLFKLKCCRVSVANRPPARPKLLPDWGKLGKTLKYIVLMPLRVGLTSGMYGSAIPAASSVKGAAISSLLSAPVILGSGASGPALSSLVASKFALPALLLNKYNQPNVQYSDSKDVDPSNLENYLLSQGVVSKRGLESLVRPIENLVGQNMNAAETYLRQNELINFGPITERLRENLSAGQSLLAQNLGQSQNFLSNAVEAARNFINQNVYSANSAINNNAHSLTSAINDNVHSLSSSLNNNVNSMSSALNDNIHTFTQNLNPQTQSFNTAIETADPIESQVLTSAQASN